jgi:hypothetical protein
MLMPSVGFRERPKPRPSLREFFEEGRGHAHPITTAHG